MYKVYEPIVCKNSFNDIEGIKTYFEHGRISLSLFGMFPEALVEMSCKT